MLSNFFYRSNNHFFFLKDQINVSRNCEIFWLLAKSTKLVLHYSQKFVFTISDSFQRLYFKEIFIEST